MRRGPDLTNSGMKSRARPGKRRQIGMKIGATLRC
jgi:hypothetical protein